MNDDATRRELAANAISFVKRNFAMETQIAKLEQLLTEAHAGRKAATA